MPGITEHTLVLPEAVDPDAVRAEDVPTLVLGLLVPGQTNEELVCRLDALARARMTRKSDEARRSHTHATMIFNQPVRGPVMVGAGRPRGYRLCGTARWTRRVPVIVAAPPRASQFP